MSHENIKEENCPNHWQSYMSRHRAEVLKALDSLESLFNVEDDPFLVPLDPHAAEVAKSCVQVVHEDRYGASRLFEEDVAACALTLGECRTTIQEARTFFKIWSTPCA